MANGGSVGYALGQFLRKQQEAKERKERNKRLLEMLSTTTGMAPGPEVTQEQEALRRLPPTEVDFEDRKKRVATQAGQPVSGSAGQPVSRSVVSPAMMVQPRPAVEQRRLRNIDELTFDELVNLGSLLQSDDAIKGLDFAEQVRQRRRPTFDVEEVEGMLYETRKTPEGVTARPIGGPGKPTKTEPEKKQWLRRGKKIVFDVPREGDVPYEKETKTGDGEQQRFYERQIKDLEDANQKLNFELTLLDAGFRTTPEGDIVEIDAQEAKLLRRNYQNQVNDNLREIQRVMKKVGETREPRGAASGVRYKVRLKKDVGGFKKGQLGEIDANEYDPDVMERIEDED